MDDVFDLSDHFRLLAGHPALMLNLSQDQLRMWHPHLAFLPSEDHASQMREALMRDMFLGNPWKIPTDVSSMKEDIKSTKPRMKKTMTPTFVCWTWLNLFRTALKRIDLLPPPPNSLFEEWLKSDLPTLVLSVTEGTEPPLPIDIPVLPTSGHSSKSASDDFTAPSDDSEVDSSNEDLSGEEDSKEENSKEDIELVEVRSPSEDSSKQKKIQLSSSAEESVSEGDQDSSVEEIQKSTPKRVPAERKAKQQTRAKQNMEKQTPKRSTPPKKTVTQRESPAKRKKGKKEDDEEENEVECKEPPKKKQRKSPQTSPNAKKSKDSKK